MFFNDAYDVSVKATNQVGYCRAIIGQMTIGFKPSQPSGSTEGPVNLSSSFKALYSLERETIQFI